MPIMRNMNLITVHFWTRCPKRKTVNANYLNDALTAFEIVVV